MLLNRIADSAVTPTISLVTVLLCSLGATAAQAAGNPVQVNVTNTTAIPVVAAPATENVVNGYCAGFAPQGVTIVRCPLYTVPAGQRLVVESVSWKLVGIPTNNTSELIFGLDDSAGLANFLPSARTLLIQHSQTYGDGSTFTTSEGTQTVKAVYEAGEIFSGEYSYASGPNFQQAFSFQGKLVPAP